MRAVLYARVSSEEQVEGYSIDAQKRAFRSLVQGRGWMPSKEYVEEGKSARTEDINKRPVFKEVITDALAGKFDVLVVHKLDRFSRNLRLTLEYFDKLLKAGVTFISMNEQMDFTTPSGKVHLALLGAFAQYYSDNLSQETKKGWAERKAQGLYCGLLPFGAIKGQGGIPMPHPETHPGLVMAFVLAARGKSDREVAIALNVAGYRTAGNQGNRPFSKDTVKGMLTNRFYLGYLPDGNDGWIKGKHEPFISEEIFNAVQEIRAKRGKPRQTINAHARTYSLSALMWCHRCGSKMRIQMSPKGRARIYCAGRAEGLGCSNKGTFLDVYEAQVVWYLENFIIPEDYQAKILEAHRKLESVYDDSNARKEALETTLKRLKELYRWGHISKEEYLVEYEDARRELGKLAPVEDRSKLLEKLAHFLANVADAWKEATQEQRNKLARTLFERIQIEDNKVVFVKPRPELEPFFKMNFESHTKDIACDPGGIRTPDLHRDRVAC
jgi:site-specific DNA recombinase